MTRYLLCVVAFAGTAYAQIAPCGNGSNCYIIGTADGGFVQLGGALQSSRYQGNQDGGQSRARVQSLSPLGTVEIVGSQSRTSQDPDVIIGGLNARDGGQGPIVSFRTGSYEIATITPTGISSNVPQTVTNLAVTGNETVTGTLAVTGNATFRGLDAGVGSKVGSVTIAVAQAQDGGTTTPLCQFGQKALTNGDAGVTFRTAFSSLPSCTCSDTNLATTAACTVSTASTTAIGVSVQSAGTDVVHYICCGDL